jgi:hypothetical protein
MTRMAKEKTQRKRCRQCGQMAEMRVKDKCCGGACRLAWAKAHPEVWRKNVTNGLCAKAGRASAASRRERRVAFYVQEIERVIGQPVPPEWREHLTTVADWFWNLGVRAETRRQRAA